jgi:hypothetical protein
MRGLLRWPPVKYKFTLGLGALGIAGMSAELWRPHLPPWLAVVIAITPLAVFVLVEEGPFRARFVGLAHTAASLWYAGVVVALLVALAAPSTRVPRAWPLYLTLVAFGAVPCGLVLYRRAHGGYPPPAGSEPAEPAQADNADANAGYWEVGRSPRSRPSLTCHTSNTKLLGLLGLTCVMVVASYFCTTIPGLPARLIGWIGISFFGLGFIAIPARLLRPGPQVVINDEGIEDHRLKAGVIRWQDIRSLSIGSVNSARFLCIELMEAEKYLSRLPRWKRSIAAVNPALGFPALTISFSGLTPGLAAVTAHLDERFAPATAGGTR